MQNAFSAMQLLVYADSDTTFGLCRQKKAREKNVHPEFLALRNMSHTICQDK